MISKNLVEFVAQKLKIERKELIEKDLILQGILQELIKNVQFQRDFAFKGGTCLIKCYLGYYRFSEDLDFTYIPQREFKGKSEKTVRKLLSQKIDWLIALCQGIAIRLNLNFQAEKTNKKYAEYGGSNKFVTLKLWYTSLILNQESFVKIQVNFVEKLFYSPQEIEARSLLPESLTKEVNFIFPDYILPSQPIILKGYSLQEILLEKFRAILTRKGIKARDFVDICLIQKETKVNFKHLNEEVLEKIIFMLKYEKYGQNLKNKEEELEKEFYLRREEILLLNPLPLNFPIFVKECKLFLKEILQTVKNIEEK